MKCSLAKLIYAPVCVVVLLAGAQGCSNTADLPAGSAAVPVQTVLATLRTITDVVHTEGVLFPVRQASLSTEDLCTGAHLLCQSGLACACRGALGGPRKQGPRSRSGRGTGRLSAGPGNVRDDDRVHAA